MSLPSQVSTDKSKHQTAAMKEAVQRTGEVYYGMGPPGLKSSHSDSASSSAVYNPEKGPQSLPHYQQQAAQVKWMQDSIQPPSWSQEAPVQAWGQSFGPYVSGVNVRSQMAFPKGVHEGVAMPMGGENQLAAPVEVYRDATQAQAQGRGLEWEQHATTAMHQAKLQAYQHGHIGVELQGQPHVQSHALQRPMLQPFQTSFRPSKQQFSSGYYSVFPGNKPMPNLGYGEQPKTQQQLLHQMQQQQQMHHHQQQQQQLHQQHHNQMQQQQQHLQQQQIQQHQMQQLQMQQQYQQQLQERQQQIQQIQQLQQQNVPQQETTQPQGQRKQQQTQNFGSFQSPEPRPPDTESSKEEVRSSELQLQPEVQTGDSSAVADPCPGEVSTNSKEPADAAPAAPRRSRRLSRDGQSPLSPPPTNIWSQPTKEPPPSQNGVAVVPPARGGENQASTGGVIQTTRRRRRASKEINLETLAQKASEMESLPAKTVKEDSPSGRQATIVPLVIPVSVPVHRSQADHHGGWAQGRLGQAERSAGHSDRKPSVIVSRRRSLRNSVTDEEHDSGLDEDGKAKFKRRPRPEPLIIPSPKASTFIPPSVYPSLTSYQSNLRSPVRLPDNPHALPPYTPPPILSPVRTGTGLYFSTFLTNIAVGNQILPPAATPKSATRSLLHSSSSEITPPVLPMIADAAPVSLEPRINIGQEYQAEIPDLQDPLSSQFDQHKANLVWLPSDDSSLQHSSKERMEGFMKMACSSVFSGGGTNQELVLHCLHECGGNFLETLERLMLQDPIFSKNHHLANYHYSGSDSWTAEEKGYFNKGISAYRKDFCMVQKLVQTKTVAQCVEFYYTYKKQVKIGRNGVLTFGPPDSPLEKHAEAVVDVKSSHQSKYVHRDGDDGEKKAAAFSESYDRIQQESVVRSLQVHDYAGTDLVPDTVNKEAYHTSVPHRPRAEPAVKKTKVPTKPPQDPDAVFPCKKCNRVFYKVKSRSAHMKSHAEQEKKAAALRQKEEEERAARVRKAAAATAAAETAAAARSAAAGAALQAGNGDGVTQQAEISSQEDTSEGEDDDDEDWH